MELGKLKYIWMRPFALLFLLIVFCLGLFLLYVSFFSDFDMAGKLFPMLHVMGFIFTGFGGIAGVVHYKDGITYTQKGKVPFNELDYFAELDNGLVAVVKNWGKMITIAPNKVLARGYVRIENQFDRHKKLLNWTLRID